MIQLRAFTQADFGNLIHWIDNEELLITIAGHEFSFPLTEQQLHQYIEREDSYAFAVMLNNPDKNIGHAQIALSEPEVYKIDKLIIGDKSLRGKGIGQALINELLLFAFTKLNTSMVELNVFDWNISGIKCYEKCGFTVHQENNKLFNIGNQHWMAINMRISKFNWLIMQS